MSDPTPKQDSCATCRHHRKESRARIEREVFDSIVEFADDDDKVFVCGLTQKEIGLDPILCDAFRPSQRKPLAELDDLIRRSEERHARRKDGEG